jgi:hypothetical protein
MIRAINPFVERLTFFWHRHWANSRESGLAAAAADDPDRAVPQLRRPRVQSQREFKDLAYAVTIDPIDAALPDRRAERQGGAERELRAGADGAVHARRHERSRSAELLPDRRRADRQGAVGMADQRHQPEQRLQLLHAGALVRRTRSSSSANFGNFTTADAVELVLAQPAHPAFIVNALWSEFIVEEPDPATLREPHLETTRATASSSSRCSSRSSPTRRLFDSVDEPNMVKPPVVYVVGAMRALGLGITDSTASDYLDAMGQQPYFPPNVAGLGGRPLVAEHRYGAGAIQLHLDRCSQTRGDPGRAGRDAGRGLRACVRGGRLAVAGRGTQSRDPQLRRGANTMHGTRPRRAPDRVARFDPRRPRRPGDVMSDDRPDHAPIRALRCADCARTDSLVTNLGPPRGSRSRPRRSPASRTASRRAARSQPALASWRQRDRVRRRSTRPRIWAGSRSGTRPPSAATPGRRTILVCIYLNGGNDGLNAIVPVGEYPAYVSQRSNIARVLGPSGGGQVGTTVMPGPAARLAFANPLVSGTGNNGDVRGSTRSTETDRGAGSDLAVFPPPTTAANLSHFESRDYWFAGALEQLETGWLGRWLDLYRLELEPAAGDLDRYLPVEVDPDLERARLRDQRASARPASRSRGRASTRTCRSPTSHPCRSTRRTSRSGAPVRNLRRDGRGVEPVSGLNRARPHGLPDRTPVCRAKLQLAATLLGAGLGTRVVTIDWGSFDTHGDQITSQDPAARGSLQRARGVQE